MKYEWLRPIRPEMTLNVAMTHNPGKQTEVSQSNNRY